jgi:CTP:molybdopterin cytidylyltransferase MocA
VTASATSAPVVVVLAAGHGTRMRSVRAEGAAHDLRHARDGNER